MHRLFRNNKARAWLAGLSLLLALAAIPPAAAQTDPEPSYRTVALEMQTTTLSRGTLSTRAEPSRTPKPTVLPTPVPPKKPRKMGYVIPPPTPKPTPKPTVVAMATKAPVAVSHSLWPVPAQFTTITTLFSALHQAIDIYAPCGTPAFAVWSGKVVYAGWKDNGGGNVVDIQFSNGDLGSYNHLSSIGVSVGQQVGAGEQVALTGMTGVATGCHLHFALQVNGVWVNPLGIL